MTPTPYALGTPARDHEFYGRSLEIEMVLGRRWTWLCGQRRMGKTSLLYALQAEAAVRGRVALFFDLTWVPQEKASGRELFRRFLRRNNGPRGILTPFGLHEADFADLDPGEQFRVLVERLQDHGREVMFLWDEAERLIDVEKNDPGFLANLRGELHGMPGLYFVLAGTQLLSSLFGLPSKVSSFVATFSWYPLTALHPDDAVALLEARKIGAWSRTPSDAIIDQSLSWSGGHPLMLAELAAELGQRSSFDGARIGASTFAGACDRLLANSSLRAIVADDFTKLTETQRALLASLCRTAGCLSLEDVAGATGESLEELRDAARLLASYGYISNEQCRRLLYGFYREMLPRTPEASQADPVKVGRIASRSIFISYCHEDRNLLDEIRRSLDPLARQHGLEVWDDTRIPAGTSWRLEIDRAMARTQAAVLIVSDDFLSSSFITGTELPVLLGAAARNACRILCLYAGSSVAGDLLFDIGGERKPLTSFQGLNSPDLPLSRLRRAQREAEVVRIVEEIVKLCCSEGPEEA